MFFSAYDRIILRSLVQRNRSTKTRHNWSVLSYMIGSFCSVTQLEFAFSNISKIFWISYIFYLIFYLLLQEIRVKILMLTSLKDRFILFRVFKHILRFLIMHFVVENCFFSNFKDLFTEN